MRSRGFSDSDFLLAIGAVFEAGEESDLPLDKASLVFFGGTLEAGCCFFFSGDGVFRFRGGETGRTVVSNLVESAEFDTIRESECEDEIPVASLVGLTELSIDAAKRAD